MPEVEPKVFRAYIAWVYSNDIDVARAEPTKSQESNDQELLMKLYLLGDFVGDRKLCKEMIRLYVTLANVWKLHFWHFETLAKVWASTMPSSPLRKVVADRMIAIVLPVDWPRIIKSLPAELVQEVAVASASQLPRTPGHAFAARLDKYLEAEAKRP